MRHDLVSRREERQSDSIQTPTKSNKGRWLDCDTSRANVTRTQQRRVFPPSARCRSLSTTSCGVISTRQYNRPRCVARTSCWANPVCLPFKTRAADANPSRTKVPVPWGICWNNAWLQLIQIPIVSWMVALSRMVRSRGSGPEPVIVTDTSLARPGITEQPISLSPATAQTR